MKKNILLLLLISGLIAANTGCTSKSSTSDEQAIENADVEKIETIDTVESAPPPTTTETAEAPTEPSLDAALNEPSTTTSTEPTTDMVVTETAAVDTTATSAPTIDNTAVTTEAPAVTETQLSPETNAITEVTPNPSAEITETPIVDASPMAVEPTATPVMKSASSGSAGLKKVSAVIPYQAKDGGWINTVYIARPKEKLTDISQKIFGSDKTKDLKAIADNAYLKSRAPKAGDKIYYTSPNRPDDSSKMLLYYEDMGLVPKTYVAKPGENLRKISKELLGYDNAWKEVWSSNSIESKTSLKDGEILRYWTQDSNEVMAMAPPSAPPQAGVAVVDSSQAPQATASMAASEPPVPAPAESSELPPPPADANANLPSPPPADASMAANAPPPPPPAVEDAAAPSPDAEAAAGVADKKKAKLDEAADEEESGGLSSDTMMSMGALGVLVALLAFVIIRKKKQKAQMNNLEMNA